MTPPTLIGVIGLGLVTQFILNRMNLFTHKKTTEFDSPKDELYHIIGHDLNRTGPTPSKNIGLPPGADPDLVEIIEETQTFIFENHGFPMFPRYHKPKPVEDIKYIEL